MRTRAAKMLKQRVAVEERAVGCSLRRLVTLTSSRDSVWSLLQGVGEDEKDKPAVVCVDSSTEVSHRELQALSLSFAGRLTCDLGYGVGDKMALVLGGNHVEGVIAQLGAAAAGVTVVTAATLEDPILEGCRGIVVSANVLQDKLPQGILAGEKHPPIVVHDDGRWGSASLALSWQNTVNCPSMAMSAAAADHNIPLAVYGGAKASERRKTQGQLVQSARDISAEIKLSHADRVALAVPLDSSFGFGSSALPGL